MRIELFDTEKGYTVIADGRFANGLTKGEALEVVASFLFGSSGLPYLKTSEEMAEWEKKYGRYKEPVGLISEKGEK